MTINAEFIAKYAKICDRLKDNTQPIFDSAKLDFEHETFTFGSQKGFGQIKMPVEGWDGKQQPFFVNITSFLNVIKEFSVLELEGYTFKRGTENSFNIAHLEDDMQFPSFISTGNQTPISIGKPEMDALKKCGLFVEVDGQAALNGIFIKDGYIWGTSRNRLCEEKVPSLSNIDISIPRSVWEVLILDVLGESLVLDKDENSFFISNGEEIKLQFSANSSLNSPDIHSDKFVASINHQNFITVNKAALSQVMGFIQPFVFNSPSQRIQLVIGADNFLEIKSEDNSNIISRKIPILEKSGDIVDGTKIWASANWIRTILSVFEGDTIKMQIDMKKPAVNITCVESPSTHVVYCRLVEQI